MTRSKRSLPRPTPIGTSAIVATLAIGVLGWGLGYAAFRIAAVMAAAAIAVAAVVARRLPDLDLEREVSPVRVERGRPAVALVMAVNRRSRFAPRTLVSQRVGSVRLDRELPALADGRSAIVSVELPTHRRGAVEIGPLEHARTDPAGLWRSTRVVAGPATLLVRPRVHPIDPRPGGRLRHIDGASTDAGRDGSITFRSLRDYVPGDDVRRIHWRSSARTGALMVREHVDATLPSTIVVLDTRAAVYRRDDHFESAVDVAASVVAASQRAGYLARLITSCGTSMTLRAGQRGQEIADHLAAVQTADDADLRAASQAVLRVRERDALVVISGDIDAAALTDVTAMARRFATPALVTIREGDPSPRWPAGLHLDGVDAEAALRRWNARSVSALPARSVDAGATPGMTHR